MGKPALKSHSTQKLLIFGEKVRENPRTILLSIPIFIFALIYYWITGYREGVAGSLGHMGIAFTNFYKHNWQQNFLLRIGYFLFGKSTEFATGEGKVSAILHCGQAAILLKDFELARRKSLEALREVKKENVKTGIEGYIYGHYLGKIELETENVGKARGHVERGLKILKEKSKRSRGSLYLQVWLSGTELTMAEYWLAKKDEEASRIWAERAKARADKYNLKVRKLDAKKLFTRIGKVATAFVYAFIG